MIKYLTREEPSLMVSTVRVMVCFAACVIPGVILMGLADSFIEWGLPDGMIFSAQALRVLIVFNGSLVVYLIVMKWRGAK